MKYQIVDGIKKHPVHMDEIATQCEMDQAERIAQLETMLKAMTYDLIELDQNDGNILGMMQDDPDMAEFLEDESVQELLKEIEEY